MNANTIAKKTHGPLARFLRFFSFFSFLGHPLIGWLLLSVLVLIAVMLMNFSETLLENHLKYLNLRNEFDRNLLESQHQIREELENIRKSLAGTGEFR